MSFYGFKMLLPFVREAQPTAGARGWSALHHQEPQPARGAPSILPLSCTGHPAPPATQEPAVPKAGKTFPPSLSHLCCMSVPLWSPWAWIWACRAPPETQWKVQDFGFRLLEEEETFSTPARAPGCWKPPPQSECLSHAGCSSCAVWAVH